jgi:5-methyltetrahydrofolate--homocysteine methyltransferase
MATNARTDRDLLADLLSRRGTLVADGGMGTSLFAMGLRPGGTPELWNVEHPEQIAAVHQGFVDAGADIILTNTFGGTRARLDLDGLGGRTVELNAAGAAVARGVADAAFRTVLVGGSVGPTGRLFEPLGPLTHAEAVALFEEQITALVAAGSDIIWIETMFSTEELEAAVAAAAGCGLPIVTTMSFDTNGSTMMGVSPDALARWSERAPAAPAGLGANCGIGPADAVVAAAAIKSAVPEAVVVVKANCGIPQVVDGTMWYPAASDDMSAYARLALDAGARIIGACCGSTPVHITQIREVVDTYTPAEGVQLSEVEAQLGEISRPAARSGHRRRWTG